MFTLFSRNDRKLRFEYRCACCGKVHRGSPSVGYIKPGAFFDVPEEERKERVRLTSDLCEIAPPADEPERGTGYFIRTTLDIPIHGVDEPFCWGVWVSQSEDAFRRYVETYDGDQSGMGSFGWLNATMPGYEERDADGLVRSVPCDVLWDQKGERPKVKVQECDHPLFTDQRDGISWERAAELAQRALHPG